MRPHGARATAKRPLAVVVVQGRAKEAASRIACCATALFNAAVSWSPIELDLDFVEATIDPDSPLVGRKAEVLRWLAEEGRFAPNTGRLLELVPNIAAHHIREECHDDPK